MLHTIEFRPGVIKDETSLASKPYWTDSDRIRFVNRLPEKIGGWEPYIETLLNGVCRGIFAWRDSSSVLRMALGTHKRLYVEEQGSLFDITPVRTTSTNVNDCFTTVSGSTLVTVTDTSHGALVGDGVSFAAATAVGGITIDGDYEVLSVVDDDNFIIQHSAAATSSTSGGGAATDITYQINVGRENAGEGAGYGVGGYGSSTYNTARTSALIFPPRVWSFDKFNANLVACPRDGSIYLWQLSTSTPAAVLANAPTSNTAIFVTEEIHLIALGAGGADMRVEWCSQNANTTWTPAATNTAGGRTLTGGNKILQGFPIRGSNLIITDGSIWTMTFVGGTGTGVFGFDRQGGRAGGAEGGISQRGGCVVDGIAFWMGHNNFYYFDGVIRRMPRAEDINDFVFNNLDRVQSEKVFCRYMSEHSEIWWFYPVGAEVSRYVKYSMQHRCWDVGGLVRTDMLDVGQFVLPKMIGADGTIYNHETTYDDDGAAMNEFITSAPFEISDGQLNVEVHRMLPDFKNQVGNVIVDVVTREYPQSAVTLDINDGVGYVSAVGDEQVDMHESGRQMAIKIGSEDAGTNWRLGTFKLDIGALGSR